MTTLSNPTSLKKYTDMNATLAPQARYTENEVAEHFCQISQENAQFGYGYFRSDPSRMPELLQDLYLHSYGDSGTDYFEWPNLPELSLNVYGDDSFDILVNGVRQPDWTTALKLCHWDASADTRGTSQAWRMRADFERDYFGAYHDNA